MAKSTFLYFKVLDNYFALDVDTVLEVLLLPEFEEIPMTPKFVRGIITLRGEIIPVIDLKVKFKFVKEPEEPAKGYLVVIHYSMGGVEGKLAFLVDKILDVINVEKLDLKEFPKLASKYNPEFIIGVLKYNETFILVLDVNKILDATEIDIIRNLNNQQLDA